MTCHHGGRGAEGSKLHNIGRAMYPISGTPWFGQESGIIAARALLSLFSSHSLLCFPISSQSEGELSLKVVTCSVVGWIGVIGVRSSGRDAGDV